MNNIVKVIQNDILDLETDISSILLKAKVLAYQLKNDNFKKWISSELDGYQDNSVLPHYRILKTYPFADISSRYIEYKRIQISLSNMPDIFKKSAMEVRLVHGIKTVEELSLRNGMIEFPMSREEIELWTWSYFEPMDIYFGGYRCLQIIRPVASEIFKQIIFTIRSHLQDFILELDNLNWNIENNELSTQKIIDKLVNIHIYHSLGNMTTFNQQSQQVQNQNNAGHNIYNSNKISTNINSKVEIHHELKRLKTEIIKAGYTETIDASVAEDVEHQLSCVIQEIKKPKPNKNSILERMKASKDLLKDVSGVTALVTGITNLIAIIAKSL